jgi:NAD(P)-dependent dehydrogenase (short-subunit alcohol dehydrogenase family)
VRIDTMKKLDGKVALVTGAARGIGAAIGWETVYGSGPRDYPAIRRAAGE